MNSLASTKFADGEMYEVIMVKLLLTATLIGTYALAKGINSKWEYPIEKALRIGNMVVWGVLIWNAANILATYLIT